MARRQRPHTVLQTATVACGATDQNNNLSLCVPGPNATLLHAQFFQVGQGTGAGTFSVRVKAGTTDFLGPASSSTFITANAAVSTYHGVLDIDTPVGTGTAVEGARLGITTVKTGSVTADATLGVQLLWQL